MSIDFTTTSVTITIYGYAVWSGLFAARADEKRSVFEVVEGAGGIPEINMKVAKKEIGRWNTFLTSIGADSILQ